ncbi:MAG: MBL fold metallo-hydrolase [Eubacteriales bacterium]|jgi:hydroxyacylglutathione hydrolase
MKILTMPVGAFQTNCYLVWDESTHEGVVIDPGYDARGILMKAAKEGIQLRYILLTHGHVDHVTAAQEIREKTGAQTVIGQGDAHYLIENETDGLGMYYPTSYPNTAPDRTVQEGDVIRVTDQLQFRVLETPGHTAGGVCFLCGEVLFSGDTLFAGSCGRTDLSTGSFPEILRSLKRLAELEGDYRVLSGHGEETTLAWERRYNPYIREAMSC